MPEPNKFLRRVLDQERKGRSSQGDHGVLPIKLMPSLLLM